MAEYVTKDEFGELVKKVDIAAGDVHDLKYNHFPHLAKRIDWCVKKITAINIQVMVLTAMSSILIVLVGIILEHLLSH
jgi:hypothetical protein